MKRTLLTLLTSLLFTLIGYGQSILEVYENDCAIYDETYSYNLIEYKYNTIQYIYPQPDSDSWIFFQLNTDAFGPYCFQNTPFERLEIWPSGLKRIGESAFENCQIANTNDLPSSVNYIGANAFSGNYFNSFRLPTSSTPGFWINPSTLEKFQQGQWVNDLSHGYEFIEEYTLQPEDVVVENGVLIEVKHFNHPRKLHYIVPETINGETIIGLGKEFLNRGGIGTDVNYGITLPHTLEFISKEALVLARVFHDFSIPSSVDSIGEYSLGGINIPTLTLPENLKHLGPRSFAGSDLQHITIPNQITKLESSVFYQSKLETVTLHNAITSIGPQAFFNNKLSSIPLPNSLLSINYKAFENNNLSSVTIPNSVTYIGDNAFANNPMTEFSLPTPGNGLFYARQGGSYYTVPTGTTVSTNNNTSYTYYPGPIYNITNNNVSDQTGYVTQYVTNGDITLSLPTPTKAGYSFEGWYTDAGFTNPIDDIATNTSGNLTLYAKFLVECTSSLGLDAISLPILRRECSLSAPAAPTATNSCTNETVNGVADKTFPITESTTITWTFMDSDNNTVTQTQNIVINDLTGPTPDLAELPTITSACPVTSLTPPTATDNCGGTVRVSHNAIFPITSTMTISWTFLDESGNGTVQVQNLIINDGIAPTPDAASLPTITEECEITTLTPPNATDNCNGNVTGSHNATLPITESTTIIWTFTDASNNSTIQTQEVVITQPTIDNLVEIIVTTDTPSEYYLSSNEQNADSYQWYSCNPDVVIQGATEQTYSPTASGTFKVMVTKSCATTTSDCSEYRDIVSGLFSSNSANGFEVFPNPSSDFIHVNSNSTEAIRVYNTAGKLMLESSVTKINVSELADGVYIIAQGEKVTRFFKG